MRRYRYDQIPITPEEAEKRRNELITRLHWMIEDRMMEIVLMESQIKDMTEAPLPTERTVQVTLMPGDLGYEELPISMSYNALDYQGDTTWVNSTQQPE
jgi:hypothetical protein